MVDSEAREFGNQVIVLKQADRRFALAAPSG